MGARVSLRVCFSALALPLALALALAFGCGGDGPPPASPATSASSARSPGADPGRPSVLFGLPGSALGPVVAVNAAGATVDGAKLADVDLAAIRKGKRSEGLVRALGEWKKAHPSTATEPASFRVVYDFDRDTTWSVIEGVLAAAAQVGASQAAFLTQLPKDGAVYPARLELEVRSNKTHSTERELHLSLSARGAVMMKWTEGAKQIGDVTSTDAVTAKLAPLIERGWNERGQHREPNDVRFDAAVVHPEPDAAYALVVVALDALHAPKRNSGGKDVAALRVIAPLSL